VDNFIEKQNFELPMYEGEVKKKAKQSFLLLVVRYGKMFQT